MIQTSYFFVRDMNLSGPLNLKVSVVVLALLQVTQIAVIHFSTVHDMDIVNVKNSELLVFARKISIIMNTV